jgi:hypothetical protein
MPTANPFRRYGPADADSLLICKKWASWCLQLIPLEDIVQLMLAAYSFVRSEQADADKF